MPRGAFRAARPPNRTEFSGQKRIGDFERRKEKFLIKKVAEKRPKTEVFFVVPLDLTSSM